MTKAELVEAIYLEAGLSKKEASDHIETLFNMMKDILARGENIKVSGFGHFEVRQKRQRRGRNPQTGEAMDITARRVLVFRSSQILKEAINSKTGIESADPI